MIEMERNYFITKKLFCTLRTYIGDGFTQTVESEVDGCTTVPDLDRSLRVEETKVNKLKKDEQGVVWLRLGFEIRNEKKFRYD